MILSVEQIQQCEQYTMQHEPISSIDLMERAASSFTFKLKSVCILKNYERIVIFCGAGNNGGDGLVVARLLALENYAVTVVLAYDNKNPTPENKHNLQRYETLLKTHPHAELVTFSSSLQFPFPIFVIDALFGIGLSKSIEGYFASVIQFINQLHTTVVALDLPSGLFADKNTPDNQLTVLAHATITFQFLKQAFLLPENEYRVGECFVTDIGLLLPEYIQPIAKLINRSFVAPLLHFPSRFAHKGKNGTGVLIAGSGDMPGAALLAAKSAMRGGIGKLILHLPENLKTVIPTFLPEAILNIDKDENHFTDIDFSLFSIDGIAIGPGIGQHSQTIAAFKNVLNEVQTPLILDADALNILANHKTYLAYLPKNSILTPHVKEFERLAGKSNNDFERWEHVKRFVSRYEVIVILKGAYSLIALPDGNLLVNTSGNPSMATAGSGDVLTGLLLALVSQGYPMTIAAILATYIHGLAGDYALENHSFESLIASDIIDHFNQAFNDIRYEK